MNEDKTCGEVWAGILNKLSDDEKTVLYFIIGKAVSRMFRKDDTPLPLTAWNNLGLSDVEKRAKMTYIDLR